MPTLKEGTLQLQVTLNSNSNLDHSIEVGNEIEGRIMAMPGVQGVVTRIGRGEAGSHGHFVNDLHMLIQLDDALSTWGSGNLDEIQDEISHEPTDRPQPG